MTELLLDALETGYQKRPEMQRLGMYYDAFVFLTEELKMVFSVQYNNEQKPKFSTLLEAYERSINESINKYSGGYTHIYNRVKKWLLKILNQSAMYYYLDNGFLGLVKRSLSGRIRRSPEYRFARGWREVMEVVEKMKDDDQAIVEYAQRIIEIADRMGYIKMLGTKEALELVLNFYAFMNKENNQNIK